MSEHLAGGSRSRVRRDGDTVVRAPNAWSPPVIELLAHLERAGFQWSPRRVGTGFTPNGDEHLTFVPGQSPQPQPWSDEAIAQVGRMIRQLHTASSSFVLTDAAPTWNEWWGRSVGDASRGVGHGDLGPWNIMAVDGLPTGFIDWDTAVTLGAWHQTSHFRRVATRWNGAQSAGISRRRGGVPGRGWPS